MVPETPFRPLVDLIALDLHGGTDNALLPRDVRNNIFAKTQANRERRCISHEFAIERVV